MLFDVILEYVETFVGRRAVGTFVWAISAVSSGREMYIKNII